MATKKKLTDYRMLSYLSMVLDGSPDLAQYMTEVLPANAWMDPQVSVRRKKGQLFLEIVIDEVEYLLTIKRVK